MVLSAATGRQWFLALYLAITCAMIVATPWQSQFRRYLVPVAPLTLLFLLLALLAIRNWLKRRDSRWACVTSILAMTVPVAGILLVQIVLATHMLQSMQPVRYYDASGRERVSKLIAYPGEWQALDSTFEWIRRHAAPTAVIATSVPHLAYLRTGHKAVLPPFESDPDIAGHLLDQVPVGYLVLDRFGLPGISERYAGLVMAHNVADWRLAFTAPDGRTRVYERTH